MGKSTSEINQELEQTRSDATEKIDKIEQQVSQSAETVKQTMSWRHQVEERPLIALGTAFLGGMLLGGMTGGDKQSSSGRSYDRENGYSQSSGGQSQGGIGGALRQAVHTSGADAAVSSAAAAVLTTAGQRVKDAIEETYPGFLDRYESSKSANGGVAERIKAASEDGASMNEAQMPA